MIDLHLGFPNVFSNLFMIIIPILVITIGIWLWALIDCITSKKETGEKLIWALIIIFLNILGAILYLILGAGKEENYFTKKNPNKEANKRLHRSRTDKIIGGVCGGIANYFNIDPVFIRLIFVLLFLLKGSGILIYIIAWIIIPIEQEKDEKIKKNSKEKNKTEITKNKNKNVGLIIFFIIFGLIIISFICIVMFTKNIYHSDPEFRGAIETRIIKDDRVIVQETYNVNEMVDITTTRILNDYNYLAYNGYDLKFLGISKSEDCIDKRTSCNKLHYEFKIDSEELDFVEGFKVNFLMQGNNYIDIEFIEIEALE